MSTITRRRTGGVLATTGLAVALLSMTLFLFTMQTQSAAAITCSVPSTHATIQAAVDDLNCDTIEVAAGTYTETVTIKRNLTLRGAGDQATYLDGENSRRPLAIGDSDIIDVTPQITVYVENLAVRNGDATMTDPPPVATARIGGGILVRNEATLYLRNARVYDNVARGSMTGNGFGGGIGLYGNAALYAENVRVYRNTANNNGSNSGFGGGLAVLGSRAYLTDTYTYQNRATTSNSSNSQGHGGGIYVQEFATAPSLAGTYLRMSGSRIYSNTAVTNNSGPALGGGLYAGGTADTQIRLYNNEWYSNTARANTALYEDGNGGAIAVDLQTTGQARLWINGDRFRDNVANAADNLQVVDQAQGGALYLDANVPGLITAWLTDTVMARNVAQTGSGGNDGTGQGGGIRARHATLYINGGSLYRNKGNANDTGQGGAIRTDSSPLYIDYARLYDNHAYTGGAVYLSNGMSTNGPLSVLNSFIVDNNASSGAGLYIDNNNLGETSYLRHVTLADADEDGNPSPAIQVASGRVAISNTILAAHESGIFNSGGTVNQDYNLFYNHSLTNTTGMPTSGGSHNQTGNPAWVNSAARNYHITGASAARNIGTNLGIPYDIDGDPRDAMPDIGADEYAQRIVLNEVYYRGDSQSDWVEIKNMGSTAVDISSWLLCSEISYGQLSNLTVLYGDLMLDPGEQVVVRAWTDLSNAADLSLYTGGPFENPANMVDYVQWGTSSNPGRADVAAAKGIWRELSPGMYDSVPTAGPGQSTAYDGMNSGGGLLTYSSDWRNGSPSPYQENSRPIMGLAASNSSPTTLGSTTYFTASIISGTNVSYAWYFGSGALRSGRTVSYTYSMTGSYTALVTATNASGYTTATTDVTIVSADATPSVTPSGTPSVTPSGTPSGTPSVTPSVSPTTTVTATPTPKTVVVEVRNNFFTPDPVTINVGDTVVWQRVEGFHNVVADDGSFRLGGENGDPSNTWDTVSHTFTTPGTFRYYCEVHGAEGGVGMAGTIIVLATEPTPSTTPSPSGTPSPSVTPSGTPSVTPSPTTPTPTRTPKPPSEEDIVINEIFYRGDTSGDWIELKNIGNGTFDISAWWFCARFSYVQISTLTIIQGDLVLGPGEIVVLQAWTNLDNTASDLGLFLDNNGGQPDFANSSFMVDFVQWGTAEDVGRSDVAAAKGIWPETSPGVYDFVPTAADDQSLALVLNNTGLSSADFRNETPTQGQENPLLPLDQSVNLPLIRKQ